MREEPEILSVTNQGEQAPEPGNRNIDVGDRMPEGKKFECMEDRGSSGKLLNFRGLVRTWEIVPLGKMEELRGGGRGTCRTERGAVGPLPEMKRAGFVRGRDAWGVPFGKEMPEW